MADDSQRQRIYLTARPIFSGSNAQLRRKKPIQELVRSHSVTFDRLLDERSEDQLVAQLQSLLKERIFESDLQAKAEFPRLFSPAGSQRDTEREASEVDAARSTLDAIERIDSGEETEAAAEAVVEDENEDDRETVVMRQMAPEEQVLGEEDAHQHQPQPQPQHAHPAMPSLWPCYVPYQTQHLLLNTVQGILEASCFDFAQRWLPEVLAKRNADCPAAIELTKWARILGKHASKLPAGAVLVKAGGVPLKKLVLTTHQLRHTAVHRLPTTARAMSQMLQVALDLVEALQDRARAAQLDSLKCELDGKIKAMELNKNVLENGTVEKLEEIRRQREELDRREAELLVDMVEEDRRNKALVGTLLEQSVDSICAVSTSDTSEAEDDHEEDPVQNGHHETDDYDDSWTDESEGEMADGIVSMTDAINAAVEANGESDED